MNGIRLKPILSRNPDGLFVIVAELARECV